MIDAMLFTAVSQFIDMLFGLLADLFDRY